ncbi:DUF4179 domain-containing protein [Alkalicoccobacillus porphyridii]|uniref:DUF4179 domain-containing protein n=1 Tax=Alkalicoccobacillus porphyridii TaxID=2597270 RepID=A0A553ZW89_9BACI|nr:DUF4179 domain-containing protein [Alkalicoccobacillus porphyridii]TSB45744.1 DUF4179 domain-containing protein [Alkalicoccobacillus porphyridii]
MRKSSESEFPKHEVRQAIYRGISQAEQQTNQETSAMTKPRKWFVFLSSSVAVGCALLIGATILTTSNTGGFTDLPLLSAFLEEEEPEAIVEQPTDLEVRRFIGESQTIEGTTVTIDEILYDYEVLTIQYHMSSDIENFSENLESHFEINADGKIPQSEREFDSQKVINPYEIEGYSERTTKDELPEEFNLEVMLTTEQADLFEFTFLIKEVEGLQKIPLHYNQVHDDMTININSITQTDQELIIPVSLIEPIIDEEDVLSPAFRLKIINPNASEEPMILSGDGYGEYEDGEQYLHMKSRIRVALEEIEGVEQLTIVPIFVGTGNDIELDSFTINLNEE